MTGSRVERVFVGLGSNLGDGPAIVSTAWRAIGSETQISTLALSRPYVSSPVGMNSRHWFTNCVGELETDLTAHELLRVLLDIEASFGRTRDLSRAGYQDRVLDLDILYYGSLSLNEPGLVIPHPRISERLFVLSPLAEIAPDWRGSGDRTALQMEQGLLDRLRSSQVPLQEIIRHEW